MDAEKASLGRVIVGFTKTCSTSKACVSSSFYLKNEATSS